MRTSLSPSVCRAFLGCQIENLVPGPSDSYPKHTEAVFVVVESDALDQAGDFLGCGSAFRDCGIHVWGFIFPWTVCLGDEKCCVWLPLSFGWSQPTPPVEAHQDARWEPRRFELIEASRVGGWYRSECHRRRSGNHNPR